MPHAVRGRLRADGKGALMAMTHIERSGFRRGEYVGYAGGRVFKITRVEAGKRTIGWQAHATPGSVRPGRENYLVAPTLAGLDRRLADA